MQSQNSEFKTPDWAGKMSNSHSVSFKYKTIQMESISQYTPLARFSVLKSNGREGGRAWGILKE